MTRMTFHDDLKALETEISGQVTIENAREIRDHILGDLPDDFTHIIIDLQDIDFLDSSGMGMLVGLYKVVRDRQGQLILVTENAFVLQLLKCTKLDSIFQVVCDRSSALKLLDKHEVLL